MVRVFSFPFVVDLRKVMVLFLMSFTCRARASEMRQPVKRQMANRHLSRELINPSLNNRFNSAAVNTFPCPFPATFMSRPVLPTQLMVKSGSGVMARNAPARKHLNSIQVNGRVKGEICLLSPLTLDLFPQNHRGILPNFRQLHVTPISGNNGWGYW